MGFRKKLLFKTETLEKGQVQKWNAGCEEMKIVLSITLKENSSN